MRGNGGIEELVLLLEFRVYLYLRGEFIDFYFYLLLLSFI